MASSDIRRARDTIIGALAAGVALLRYKGRLTYVAPQHEFELDDATLDAIRVGAAPIDAIFQGISRDRHGAFQPVVEVACSIDPA